MTEKQIPEREQVRKREDSIEELAERREGPKRIPLGRKQFLKFAPREGFHRCLVNDYNVEGFLAAGYEFVRDQKANQCQRRAQTPSSFGDSVVRIDVGGGLVGYLMEIPNEIYEEDQKDNAKRRKERMATIDSSNKKSNYK